MATLNKSKTEAEMAFSKRDIILFFLELCAVGSCAFGMCYVHGYSPTIIALCFNAMWFILGILSNLFGMMAILFYNNIFTDKDMQSGHLFLQSHYLMAWFSVIFGYQQLVVWFVYTGSNYALLHLLLIIIPMLAWYLHKNQIIALTTQLITAIALMSHFYISYLASNTYGEIGASLMIFIVVFFSLPAKYSLLGVTSQQSFTIGLGCASYFFAKQVQVMSEHPKQVTKFMPW